MLDRNASTSLVLPRSSAPRREQPATARHTTPPRVRHGWILGVAAALAGALGACGGGGGKVDNYQRATSEQETCCEMLSGGERDQCLSEIVRVDDPAVAKTDANQDTYRCVEQNFVCDPQTGRATQDSAQRQYDCIAALSE